MIDFHSHILPKVDDGSKSIEESIELLGILKRQGIEKVFATPHFYANRMSVDEFVERRFKSYNKLMASVSGNLPEIILGAEVKYYSGISRLDNLKSLCMGDSKLLLLEMPMCKWTGYTVNEVLELSSSGSVKVVLAHIERYLKYQDKGLLEELVDNGVLIQANADFFLTFGSRRKALSMLKSGLIHFIGSDCHDLVNRPPRIGEAYSYIQQKVGEDFLLDFINSSHTDIK